MRVAITDSDLRAGRALAAAVERLVPTADILLYDDAPAALEGIGALHPDVVFVAPAIGSVTGPELVAQVNRLDDVEATVVGIVDGPDAGWSTRYVEAGAGVVVSRPVDDLGIRAALRQRAGGIPGPT
jgi:AmiR/NasT family two-component response regulator